MATFYLTYRPQTVSDLDLVSVRKQLTQVLQAKDIPHAFLFSGPRGLGKTSAARIVAKSVNCLKNRKKKGDFEPCNTCDACKTITKGTSMDVIEIDGASNRGIDDVRMLREGVQSAPAQFKRKVYVIDEVHMLTREAFNALLKTLEEPPEHVMFILATTEFHKVPDTIVSRAFHIQFQRATKKEIKRALQKVVKGEKLQVSDEILDRIIAKAQGGFRDSIKMLEQLAFIDTEITDTVFEQVFVQADIGEFFTALQDRNAKAAFKWIQSQQSHGVDWEDVLRRLLLELEQHLLSFFGVVDESNYAFDVAETKKLIQLCTRASRELKSAVIETLPLELAVAEWVSEAESQSGNGGGSGNTDRLLDAHGSQVRRRSTVSSKTAGVSSKTNFEVARINGKGIGTNGHRVVTNGLEKQPKLESVRSTDKVVNSRLSSETLSEKPNDQVEDPEMQQVSRKQLAFTATQADVEAKWGVLLQKIKENNYSTMALLQNSQLSQVTDGVVEIKVYYEFHKDRLETAKCVQAVQQAFENVFACSPEVRYILGGKEEKSRYDQNRDQALAQEAEAIFS